MLENKLVYPYEVKDVFIIGHTSATLRYLFRKKKFEYILTKRLAQGLSEQFYS